MKLDARERVGSRRIAAIGVCTLMFAGSIVLLGGCRDSEAGRAVSEARQAMRIAEEAAKEAVEQAGAREEAVERRDGEAAESGVGVAAEGEPTREQYEARLEQLGVPLYEGAEFERIRENRYGGGYSIVYTLPDGSSESVSEVRRFYREVMAEIAEREGWSQVQTGGVILTDGSVTRLSFTNLARHTDKVHTLTFWVN